MNDEEVVLMSEKVAAKRYSLPISRLQYLRYINDGPPWIKLGKTVRYNLKAADEFFLSKTRYTKANRQMEQNQ